MSTSRRFRQRGAGGLLVALLLAACSQSQERNAAAPTPPGSTSPAVSAGVDATRAHVAAQRRLPPTAPGQKPPQFIVVSFDGAGNPNLWKHWLQVSHDTGAHFTFFLSGVYLLTEATRKHYLPPRHAPGSSDIGFAITEGGPDPVAAIGHLIDNLNTAYLSGHEIGSHFNGHFCSLSRGVGSWNRADWTQEIHQFDQLMDNVNANNGLSSPHPVFTSKAVLGARTPCLAGKPSALYPAEVAAGWRYDASTNAPEGVWPFRKGGLWQMPLASARVAGTSRHTLSSDYNMYTFQTSAKRGPASRFPALRSQALATWQGLYDRSYRGDRSPVIIGNHFETWNGGAYTDSLTDFLEANCRKPDTYCVSNEELLHWLQAEPPATLAALSKPRS